MKPGAEGPVVVRQDAVDDDHFICTCPQQTQCSSRAVLLLVVVAVVLVLVLAVA
eukprot:COSAG05_NODE_4719_length_1399_cov_1.025385_1_plen_54_part_00